MTVTATIHTPPPEPQPDRRVVTLTMPYDVAVTLLSMTHYVSGSPSESYRMHMDRLQTALYNANVDDEYERFEGDIEAQPIPTE